MLNLRSAPSGPLFEGDAQGDTLLWDEDEQKFFVGQLARRSCMLTLASNGEGAVFNSGGTTALGYMQPNVQPNELLLEGDAAFAIDADNVFAVRYTGPDVVAMATVCASVSNGDATDITDAGLGIDKNEDLAGVDYGNAPAVRAGVQRLIVPAAAEAEGSAVSVMTCRRRLVLTTGDVVGVVGALGVPGTLDVLSISLTVEQV